MHGHTILLDSVPNGLLKQSYIIFQGAYYEIKTNRTGKNQIVILR